MLKNISGQSITALLLDTNGDAVTAGTTTVYVTGDAGTQTAGTGTVTHEGNGQWSYLPTQDETNYDSIAFLFVNPDSLSVNLQVFTEVSAIVPGSLGVVIPGAITVTGYQLIENALKEINVLDPEDTVSAAMLEHGRQRLNRMLDLWKTRNLFVYAIDHEVYVFTTSKTNYSIGPTGADFTAGRPLRIDRANLVRVGADPDQHVPLITQEIQDFADIPYRLEDGEEPTHLYYQPTVPNGTLWPWPYPEDTVAALANKLELFLPYQIDVISDCLTEFALPYGYEEAITQTLAELLCTPYEKTVSGDLARSARKARAAIATVNSRAPKISTRDTGVPMSEAY